MNRFFAIPGCIAVFSAFLLGPFTHLHDAVEHDDHAGEERAAIVHSHISFDAPDVVESGQTTVHRPRHSGERQLTIFDFQKQSPAPQPELMSFSLHVPEWVVVAFVPEIPDPVAHGPPRAACFGLRSPPAQSCLKAASACLHFSIGLLFHVPVFQRQGLLAQGAFQCALRQIEQIPRGT